MWRRNASGVNSPENQDSDQSISEEEGFEDTWKEHAFSFSAGPGNYEGGMRVVSQLEILKDYFEIHPTNDEDISSHERKKGFGVDDEVENPSFDEDNDSIQQPRINSSNLSDEGPIFLQTMPSISKSEEEIISDDEVASVPTLKNATEDVSGTWSKARLEVKALVGLHETSGCSSSHGVTQKVNKSRKGDEKAKTKGKFSFHFRPSKDDSPLLVGDGNKRLLLENLASPKAIGAAFYQDMGKVMVVNQVVVGDKAELQEDHIAGFELSKQHDCKNNSMAESLVRFHEMTDLMLGNPEGIERKGIGENIILDKCTSPVGKEGIDADNLPDSLDSGPSSEDELFVENYQNVKSIIPRTMADQFDEAFGTVSVNDQKAQLALPGPLCWGLYERLQRIMEIEKERDMHLKISNAKTNSSDERACISVRILSRSLEAKLTVCSCATIGDGEDSLLDTFQTKMPNAEKNLTIVFSSSMGRTVDLEVGNVIRLHPPWKEVQMKRKDTMVILCSYYSQVH